MLYDVLMSINNFYVRDHCDVLTMLNRKITVEDESLFVVGQYLLILGSLTNDGVYKIKAISGNELELDIEFNLLTQATDEITVCSLAIPKSLLDLVTQIETYDANNDGSIQSESLGDYSVSYGAKESNASWNVVFKQKLAPYKKAYLNLPSKRLIL